MELERDAVGSKNRTKNKTRHYINTFFKLGEKREETRHLQFGGVDLFGWFKVKFESGKVLKYFFMFLILKH